MESSSLFSTSSMLEMDGVPSELSTSPLESPSSSSPLLSPSTYPHDVLHTPPYQSSKHPPAPTTSTTNSPLKSPNPSRAWIAELLPSTKRAGDGNGTSSSTPARRCPSPLPSRNSNSVDGDVGIPSPLLPSPRASPLDSVPCPTDTASVRQRDGAHASTTNTNAPLGEMLRLGPLVSPLMGVAREFSTLGGVDSRITHVVNASYTPTPTPPQPPPLESVSSPTATIGSVVPSFDDAHVVVALPEDALSSHHSSPSTTPSSDYPLLPPDVISAANVLSDTLSAPSSSSCTDIIPDGTSNIPIGKQPNGKNYYQFLGKGRRKSFCSPICKKCRNYIGGSRAGACKLAPKDWMVKYKKQSTFKSDLVWRGFCPRESPCPSCAEFLKRFHAREELSRLAPCVFKPVFNGSRSAVYVKRKRHTLDEAEGNLEEVQDGGKGKDGFHKDGDGADAIASALSHNGPRKRLRDGGGGGGDGQRELPAMVDPSEDGDRPPSSSHYSLPTTTTSTTSTNGVIQPNVDHRWIDVIRGVIQPGSSDGDVASEISAVKQTISLLQSHLSALENRQHQRRLRRRVNGRVHQNTVKGDGAAHHDDHEDIVDGGKCIIDDASLSPGGEAIDDDEATMDGMDDEATKDCVIEIDD